MAVGTLLLALALFIIVALLIAIPLMDKKAPAVLPPTRRQQLEAQRVAAVRAIRELDFDYRTGKLDSADYKTLREAQVAEGAAVLQQIDALKRDKPVKPVEPLVAAQVDDDIEAEIQKRVNLANRQGGEPKVIQSP